MPNERSTLNPQPSTEPMSDALKFLLVCCKTDPSEADINFVCSFLNTERLMLNALIALANQHGILPLVYKTLKQFQSESAFTHHELLPAFKQQYLNIARRNMLMSAELIRIMKLLEENNIEALAFKGPALSQMTYGDITLRQYVDLDVLVKKEDIYRVDALLKDLGYQRAIALTDKQEKLWLVHKHDFGLYHPKNGVHFEMHWSLQDEDYPVQMNQDPLWEDPQTIKLDQHEIKTFPNEALLLYLCIHGSTHLWERIEWIKDIDLLIRKQTIDWEKMAKATKDSNVETILYLGIYLAHSLFSTELPDTVIKRIFRDKKLSVIADYIVKSWDEDKSGGIGGTLRRTLAMLRLFPNTKAQLSYLHKILLKPTLNEYDYVDLPKGMYWAYYFVRPYLLAKKYISKN